MTHHQPLFYNDEHAIRLLQEAPRFANVYVINAHCRNPETRHIFGSAHSTRELANKTKTTRFNGNAQYRIVVRLKNEVPMSKAQCRVLDFREALK